MALKPLVVQPRLYRIVQPYRPRDPNTPTNIDGVARRVFPFKDVTPYVDEDLPNVLRTFNQKWLDMLLWPPYWLEAWAEPLAPGEPMHWDIDLHSCAPKTAVTLRQLVLRRFRIQAARCSMKFWDYLNTVDQTTMCPSDQLYLCAFLRSAAEGGRMGDLGFEVEEEDRKLDCYDDFD